MSKAFVTKPAPAWTADALMPNGEFATLKSEQFKVCPTEIIAFSDRANEFHKINCELIGASVDSKYAHHAWVAVDRKKGGIGPNINIPLLADPTHVLSKDFGVFLEEEGHTLRGLFIISPEGVLMHALHNAPAVGRSVDETLRLVQGYQYAAQHGEVCPAGWKPGQATIKPTPAQKVEFFGKTY